MNNIKTGILIGSLESGGAERMALRLLDLFDAAGMEVYLILINKNIDMQIHADPLREKKLRNRIVILSKADINQGTCKKIALTPVQLHRLERVVKAGKLDLIISFMERANIFNMLGRTGRHKIISIRSPLISDFRFKQPLKKYLILFFYSLFLKRVSNINFNSLESRADFSSVFGKQPCSTSMIYNFCDNNNSPKGEDCSAVPGEYIEIFQQYRVVIGVGRFLPVKGFGHLIRAFKKVYHENKDARLVLVGDGPLKQELIDISRELGIDQAIYFPGFIKDPGPWMQKASIFVLPSLSEGLPNVLLEAMALGKAVVSADCISGPSEILNPVKDCTVKARQIEKGEFGILVPPMAGNSSRGRKELDLPEEMMANAVSELLQDDSLRRYYGNKAFLRAQDFSPEIQSEKWMSLIKAVVKR